MYTYQETISTAISLKWRNILKGDYKIYTDENKMNARESLAGKYIQMKLQRMECDWMTSPSNGGLARE